MTAYKSKMVERIHLPSREVRDENLEAAGYNVFNLPSKDVYIDLLTDSGTGTMSAEQWAAMMLGDEAYAGSSSFENLKDAVSDVMGMEYVVPTHQGRGAENVLYGTLLEEGDVVPNNTHFDTTRAHIANAGAEAVDCPVSGAMEMQSDEPFKGNFDIEKGWDVVEEHGEDAIPVVVLTITNNSTAGQPVSMANIRAVSEFAAEIDATFVMDACRFAENAYFIQQREEDYEHHSIADIAREELSYADALVMSGKKDALVNIGGFVACRDADLFEHTRQRAILYEGFSTYGGLAGRDIEAMAQGLREAVTQEYVESRVGQVQELAGLLDDANLPVYLPAGGHAVYLDAEGFFPHIPLEEFPGQALVCELYREGGVRGVELGSFAFPGTNRPELVRLALPRRTYNREHLEHIAETVAGVYERRDSVSGLEIVSEPPMKELRHFSAELRPV
ncbi:tryptophanase [Haladaptatus sp. YSMS36]|uniref:tryptophanase n=1 Tax=Haladaptatus sp. YSMS36 TaxID=3033384 RepID=UPI0023E8E72D|nr:tryptophanase [Haladaptatus sp. YSMS36]